jgi:hypothetical protein
MEMLGPWHKQARLGDFNFYNKTVMRSGLPFEISNERWGVEMGVSIKIIVTKVGHGV